MYNNGNSSNNVTGASVVDGTMESADFPDNGLSADKIDGGTLSNVNVDDTTAANIIAQVDDNEISGDKIDAGVISNFQSTGIDDRAATGKALYTKGTDVGVGASSPISGSILQVSKSSSGITSITGSSAMLVERAGNVGMTLGTANTGEAAIFFADTDSNTVGRVVYSHSDDSLRFWANGSERARVTASGLTFNGDTAAANALDDYEEGTFTPVVSGATTAGAGTYTSQNGRYTKIGNQVFFLIDFIITAHTGTGVILITGLPYTSSNSYFPNVSVSAQNLALTANYTHTGSIIGPNGTTFYLQQSPVGGGSATGIPIDSACDVRISGVYQAG
jgi:hypothetical protein